MIKYISILLIAGTSLLIGINLNTKYHQQSASVWRVDSNGNLSGPSNLPYKSESDPQNTYKLLIKVNLNNADLNSLQIKADDCILELKVNNKLVRSNQIPLCDWKSTITIENIETVLAGENTIEATVKNLDGSSSLNLKFISSQIALSINLTLIISSCFLLLYMLARLLWKDSFLSVVFAMGGSLRILYFIVTPFTSRPHDVYEHIDYIRHALITLSLPMPLDGYQFYHPPLYYWLNALCYRLFQLLAAPISSLGESAMLTSLILSVLTLAFGLDLLVKSYASLNKKNNFSLLVLACLLASFPGLIITTIRVNNDSLGILFGTIFVWCIYNWHLKQKLTWWIGSSLVISLGLITKLNLLTLLPILLLIFSKHYKLCLRTKFMYLLISFGFISVIFGPYICTRINTSSNKSYSLFSNPKGMNKVFTIKKEALRVITFNPIEVIKFPMVVPWNDTQRRWAFPEYFFKSAFFGEFAVPQKLLFHAKCLLAVAMLCLPLLISKSLMSYNSLPLTLAIVSGLCGIIYFRFRYAAGPVQDFRYFAHVAAGLFAVLTLNLNFNTRFLILKNLLLFTLFLIQSSYMILLCLNTFTFL